MDSSAAPEIERSHFVGGGKRLLEFFPRDFLDLSKRRAALLGVEHFFCDLGQFVPVMPIADPINVAISPTLAAWTAGSSVTSIGNRSKEGRPTTGQRCPPSTAYSLLA